MRHVELSDSNYGRLQPGGGDPIKKIFDSMDGMKTKIEEVNRQFKDAPKTTFVAVFIPEFVSIYETERIAILLAKQEIEIHNIVINKVLFPNLHKTCKKCVARRNMQDK